MRSRNAIHSGRTRSTSRLQVETLEGRLLLNAGGLGSAAPLNLANRAIVSGTLDSVADYYSFTLQETGRVTANVHAAAGDSRLTLFNAQGEILLQSSGLSPTNRDDRLDLHLAGASPGTQYYLEVKTLSGSGSYSLDVNHATALPPFQPLPAGNATVEVAPADLNGDGICDLIASSFSDFDVSVYYGLGDGTFSSRIRLQAGAGTEQLVAGDFNNDGRLDIVATNSAAGSMSLFLSLPDGTFAPQVSYAAGVNPVHLVAEDLNNDGQCDLAVTDSGTNQVYVFLGNSDGTFATPAVYYTGGNTYDLQAADLDEDGRLDLIVTNPGLQQVHVLRNRPSGFELATPITLPGDSLRVIVADFNADGHEDLATSLISVRKVAILYGHGSATFSAPTLLEAGELPDELEARDFNGDGRLDLAINCNQEETVSIFFQTASGGFTTPVQALPGSRSTYMNAADFNGDGVVDLVSSNVGGTTIAVALGRGDGTFLLPRPAESAAGTYAALSEDLNHDGRLDLVTVNYVSNETQIMLGRGDGTFQLVDQLPTEMDPLAVAAGDLNHDGHLDLVFTSFVATNIKVFLGHGTGRFDAPRTYALGAVAFAVVLEDLNSDGNLDVLTSSYASSGTLVLHGDGQGGLSPPLVHGTGVGAFDVLSADLDNDGRRDIVSANFQTNDVSILFGQPDGTLGQEQRIATGFATFSVVAQDFDLDGWLDLAVSAFGTQTVSLLHGGPGRTFTQGLVLSVADPFDLASDDLDGDGRPDLVVTHRNMGSVTVLFGNGDGSFAGETTLPVGLQPTTVVLRDVDGNGHKDLLVANFVSSSVSVLLNDGQRDLHLVDEVAVPNGPLDATSADFNGDGFLDVATADYSNGTVSLRLGLGDGALGEARILFHTARPRQLVTADFNHDGRLDLAVGDCRTTQVTTLLGRGDGTFTVGESRDAGGCFVALTVGDLNGDGRGDLVIANYGLDRVAVALGLGNGGFAPLQFYATGDGPAALALGDLNSDGRLDLVVANALGRSVTVLLGSASGGFAAPLQLALDGVPDGLALADFNGDGRLDLAVSSGARDTVWVFAGRGDGTFAAPSALAAGDYPAEMSVADFNQDGHLDLGLANNESGNIHFLLGNGAGGFQVGTPFHAGQDVRSLFVADLNNDSRPDLVTANGLGTPVTVGLNLGDGTFADALNLVRPNPSRPLIADLNGDGVNDLAILRNDGALLVRLGRSASGVDLAPPMIVNPGAPARDVIVLQAHGQVFLATIDVREYSLSLYGYQNNHFVRTEQIGHLQSFLTRIATGDANQDGRMDLLLLDSVNAHLDVIVQTPTGWQSQLNESDVGAGASDLLLIDVGSGKAIVVVDANNGDVRSLRLDSAATITETMRFQAGNGVYSAGSQGTELTSAEGSAIVLSGRFDGDGHTDLIVVNQQSQRLALLRGDGYGGFLAPLSPPGLLTGQEPVDGVAGDFNNDGDLDVAVLQAGSADISVLLGDGQGGFSLICRADAGNMPAGLSMHDLNGDGRQDLLVGNQFGDLLTLLGNGDGTFRPYQRLDQTTDLAVSDLDGDGRADFVLADAAQDQIVVRYSGALAEFRQGRLDGLRAPGAVTVADLDRDGHDDLLLANSGSNEILVYRGLPQGGLAAHEHFFAGTNPQGISVIDLDGDRILDVVVANEGSNDVSILLGRGQGSTWSLLPGPRLRVGTGPLSTAVRDVNDDGVADILVANRHDHSITLLHGVGGGFFDDRAPLTLDTLNGPREVLVGQFDRHPGIDALAVSDQGVTFFSGLGSGRTINASLSDITASLTGDFDRDGFDDVVLISEVSNRVSLLLGSSEGLLAASVLATPELFRPTDIALSSLETGLVRFYVSGEGDAGVVELTFILSNEIEPIPPDSSPSLVDVRPGSELTSVGDSPLETVVTLVFTSTNEDASAIPFVASGSDSTVGASSPTPRDDDEVILTEEDSHKTDSEEEAEAEELETAQPSTEQEETTPDELASDKKEKDEQVRRVFIVGLDGPNPAAAEGQQSPEPETVPFSSVDPVEQQQLLDEAFRRLQRPILSVPSESSGVEPTIELNRLPGHEMPASTLVAGDHLAGDRDILWWPWLPFVAVMLAPPSQKKRPSHDWAIR